MEFPEDRKAARNTGVFAIILSSIYIIVMCYLFKSYAMPQSNPFAWVIPILLVIAGVAVIIISYRGLNAGYYHKTDPEGIFRKSMLNRQYIRWDEVIYVETIYSEDETAYILKSDKSSIRVTEEEGNLKLIASIWQHLDKVDKSDGMLLSKGAFAAWEPVSNDVPEVVVWINPNPPRYRIYASLVIIGCLIFVVTIVQLVIENSGFTSRLSAICWSTVTLVVFGKFMLDTSVYSVPKGISITEDILNAEMYFRSLDVKLSQVKDANWEELSLRIRYQHRKTILIPYIPGNPNSKMLMLAIIRRLRLSPSLMFMPIPKELLHPKEDGS
ncbi:MAG: hypothetical protein ACYC0V_02165 [Armatimonadota bacterium]